MVINRRLIWAVSVVLVCSGIVGCAAIPGSSAGTSVTVPPVADIVSNAATVNVDADAYSSSPFWITPLRKDTRQRLPDKQVDNVYISDTALHDGLSLLLDQAQVALRFEGGAGAGGRNPATVHNLSGNLPDVVERLAQSFGFFYRYENGLLHVSREELFVLELPPVLNDDSLADISNAIQYLGAQDIYLDRGSRAINFRASRHALDYITQYVDRVRETRSMLVYDLYIYQVDLNDGNQNGIKWNKFVVGTKSDSGFKFSGSGGKVMSEADASNAFSVGVIYNSSHFSLDALVQFLRTHGTVKTISQPRIALMSGSRGKLRMGQSTRYVSKVGTSTGTSVSQTTVETNDLQTGLDLSLYGEIHDGTVYTRLALTLTNLIQFNRFTALDTNLTLPQTSDREYRSTVRAVPGDTILLGGLIEERNIQSVSGLPGMQDSVVLGNSNNSHSKSELVLVLKARTIAFLKGSKKDVAEHAEARR